MDATNVNPQVGQSVQLFDHPQIDVLARPLDHQIRQPRHRRKALQISARYARQRHVLQRCIASIPRNDATPAPSTLIARNSPGPRTPVRSLRRPLIVRWSELNHRSIHQTALRYTPSGHDLGGRQAADEKAMAAVLAYLSTP